MSVWLVDFMAASTNHYTAGPRHHSFLLSSSSSLAAATQFTSQFYCIHLAYLLAWEQSSSVWFLYYDTRYRGLLTGMKRKPCFGVQFFFADSDPAQNLIADLDPGWQSNADPDPVLSRTKFGDIDICPFLEYRILRTIILTRENT